VENNAEVDREKYITYVTATSALDTFSSIMSNIMLRRKENYNLLNSCRLFVLKYTIIFYEKNGKKFKKNTTYKQMYF
jgi:hypothetical protein